MNMTPDETTAKRQITARDRDAERASLPARRAAKIERLVEQIAVAFFGAPWRDRRAGALPTAERGRFRGLTARDWSPELRATIAGRLRRLAKQIETTDTRHGSGA